MRNVSRLREMTRSVSVYFTCVRNYNPVITAMQRRQRDDWELMGKLTFASFISVTESVSKKQWKLPDD